MLHKGTKTRDEQVKEDARTLSSPFPQMPVVLKREGRGARKMIDFGDSR